MLFSTESMLDHESQLVDWYTIVEQLPPHSMAVYHGLSCGATRADFRGSSYFLSAGQVFVKAPLQACENLADMTRPFERLRSA